MNSAPVPPRLLLVASALLLLTTSGCSLTLAGIVAADEARSEREAQIMLDELAQTEPGTPLHVRMQSGQLLEGAYVDLRLARPDAPDVRSQEQALVLNVDGQDVALPLGELAHVQRARKRHSVMPAFLIGGVVDAGLLYVLLTFSVHVPLTL